MGLLGGGSTAADDSIGGPFEAGQRARSADMGGAAFAWVGSGLVLLGVLSVLTGIPTAAHYLAPVASPADGLHRLVELSLPLSAAVAALVAFAVATLLAAGRLRARPAVAELLVLGCAIEASVLASAHRIGYAADGTILPAAVGCVAGGAAVVIAALLVGLAERR